jgi:hypothetical protein
MLDLILNRYVPKELFPDVSAKLLVNRKFEIYIKSIIWNATKHIGKKVTKDSGIRIGLVSLSDKDFVI